MLGIGTGSPLRASATTTLTSLAGTSKSRVSSGTLGHGQLADVGRLVGPHLDDHRVEAAFVEDRLVAAAGVGGGGVGHVGSAGGEGDVGLEGLAIPRDGAADRDRLRGETQQDVLARAEVGRFLEEPGVGLELEGDLDRRQEAEVDQLGARVDAVDLRERFAGGEVRRRGGPSASCAGRGHLQLDRSGWAADRGRSWRFWPGRRAARRSARAARRRCCGRRPASCRRAGRRKGRGCVRRWRRRRSGWRGSPWPRCSRIGDLVVAVVDLERADPRQDQQQVGAAGGGRRRRRGRSVAPAASGGGPRQEGAAGPRTGGEHAAGRQGDALGGVGRRHPAAEVGPRLAGRARKESSWKKSTTAPGSPAATTAVPRGPKSRAGGCGAAGGEEGGEEADRRRRLQPFERRAAQRRPGQRRSRGALRPGGRASSGRSRSLRRSGRR